MKKITFRKKENLSFEAVEAFNALRTNILFSGKDIKSITLTSCTPNEGKTSVSFQMANFFAQMGKKVLFVDADVRKSVITGHYKVDSEVFGLTHYLTGQKTLDDVIYECDTENMHVIFAGPVAPNPTELLGSDTFASLLEGQRENYDYIIVDAPPLGSVIDAALIAKHVDGAILVIKSGAISYRMVQGVKAQLEKSECRILGAILNRVGADENSYYGSRYGYSKYYKQYGSYYGKSEEPKIEIPEK